MCSYDVDIHECTFAQLSDEGKLCSEEAVKLSKKEIAGLCEDGFTVFRSCDTQYDETCNAIPCIVDWSEPFHDPLPVDTANAIIFYIEGVIDRIPQELNLAQRYWLCAITVRAKNNNK